MALDPAYREQFGLLFNNPEELRKRIAAEEEEDLRLAARGDDMSAVQSALQDPASYQAPKPPEQRADAPTGYAALYSRRPVPVINEADAPSLAGGKPDPTVVPIQKPPVALPETVVSGAATKPVAGKKAAPKDPSEVSSSEILDKYFAENFGDMQDIPSDDDGDGKPGITPEDPNAPTPGLVVAQESRKRSNIEIDPEQRADLSEARDTILGKTKEMVEAEDMSRQATRFAETKAGAQKDAIEAEAIKKQRQLDESFKSKLAKHQRLGDELRAVEVEDPSLWTGETGKDIGTAIGLTLLGFLGGPQLLLPQINAILERDMQTQKERLAKKRADWETDGLLLDRVAKVYDTDEARDNAARMLALQGVERQLQQEMAAAQDPVVKARGEVAVAQLQEELTMREIQQEALTRGEVMTTYAAPRPTGGGGPADPNKELKWEKEHRELQGWKPELYVPDAGGYATNPDNAKAMIAAGESVSKLNGLLLEMKQIHNSSVAGKLPLNDARSRFVSLRRQVQLAIKNGEELGALDNGAIVITDDMAPDTRNPGAGAAYDALMRRATINYRDRMRKRGLIDGPAPRNFRNQSREGLDIQKEGDGGEPSE